MMGAEIVAQSLDAPLKRIAENALFSEEAIGLKVLAASFHVPLNEIVLNPYTGFGSLIAEYVRNAPFNQGYNAITGEYVDMIASGIIDPAKVIRIALQNAASIAGMVLSTEVIVTDLAEKKEAAPAGSSGGVGDERINQDVSAIKLDLALLLKLTEIELKTFLNFGRSMHR
jgi:chaperonin GroEL